MKDDNLLLLAALATGGFILYKTGAFQALFKEFSPRTPTERANEFKAAGYTASLIPASKSLSGQTVTALYVPPSLTSNVNTTYLFSQEDLNRENWAQRFLLTLGLPARWIYG